jgi:hypothetical protein
MSGWHEGQVFALVATWTRDLDVPLQGVRALQRQPRWGPQVNFERP